MKLIADKIVKKYGVRTVVKGVSMEVQQGEIVGFLGPNGAGKTTSFYMITGQVKPNGGNIYLEDDNGVVTEITTLPMYQRAQKGIGYLPQEASVFRKMSVEDNIMSVMEISNSTRGMTKAQRVERMEKLIDEFNLSKVRKSLGIQLSGGERRRCEIARALAVDPKFILLDEPFDELDDARVFVWRGRLLHMRLEFLGQLIRGREALRQHDRSLHDKSALALGVGDAGDGALYDRRML